MIPDMTNTERPASLHAYLSYRDAPAALRWLERAFGFETTLEFPDERGGIMHAEMRREGVSFSVFTDEEGYDRPARKGDTIGHGLYVSLGDHATIDAIHRTAVAEGATEIWGPAETEWGTYRFRVLDPEGYEWTVGTFVPGESQADWSDDAASGDWKE